MPSLLVAYDSDCGSCTRFRHSVELFDLRNQIEFISLVDADDAGLLDSIPRAERHTAFHVILPDGAVLSGAEAVPRLIESLPAGGAISKVMSTAPGGIWLISHLYSNFSRAHNGSACSYHGPRARPAAGSRGVIPPLPSSGHRPRSTYRAAGALGGLAGAMAMGLFVGLPDGLCVALATAIAGGGPIAYALAWTFHLATGVVVGMIFGQVTGAMRLGHRKGLPRSLVSGLMTGLLVWSGFFLPLMFAFLPGMVTDHLLRASFAAHVTLGLVLGIALSVALTRSSGSNRGSPKAAPAS